MPQIKINGLAAGVLGYIVRRCPLDRECITEDAPPCAMLEGKQDCYLKSFLGPNALDDAQAYVASINPKGNMARKLAK